MGNDFLRCRLGNMRILREHDRDGLANEADLVHGQDRLVMKRRPVIRVGYDFADVLGSDDAIDAWKSFCRANVDGPDAAMRHSAAKDLSKQHAWQTHGVRVFGAAADFLARFETRQRAPDLSARNCGWRHWQPAPKLCAAWAGGGQRAQTAGQKAGLLTARLAFWHMAQGPQPLP